MGKKFAWHKLASSIGELSFCANGMLSVSVGGKTICLVLKGDVVHACTQKCPHAGGMLADGYIDASGNVVCPLHRYRFNVENGRNVSGEGYYLKTYPVEMRPDGI